MELLVDTLTGEAVVFFDRLGEGRGGHADLLGELVQRVGPCDEAGFDVGLEVEPAGHLRLDRQTSESVGIDLALVEHPVRRQV